MTEINRRQMLRGTGVAVGAAVLGMCRDSLFFGVMVMIVNIEMDIHGLNTCQGQSKKERPDKFVTLCK